MPERAFAAELQHLANRFRKCLLDVMGRQVVQGRLLCSAQLWEATDPGAVRRGPCSPCSLALAASASAPGCAAPRSPWDGTHPQTDTSTASEEEPAACEVILSLPMARRRRKRKPIN